MLTAYNLICQIKSDLKPNLQFLWPQYIVFNVTSCKEQSVVYLTQIQPILCLIGHSHILKDKDEILVEQVID